MLANRLTLALGATLIGLGCNDLIGLKEGEALTASTSSNSSGATGTTGSSGSSSSSGSTSSSTSSSSTSSSTTSSSGDPIGCSDGTREAYVDFHQHPSIAGCAGGFSIPGLVYPIPVMCGRAAGDAGKNPQGTGCSAADLCALGWHVCTSAVEVSSLGAVCDNTTGFWATSQGVDYGAHMCGPTFHNDVAGCGTLGGGTNASCVPLMRLLSLNQGCGGPWDCGSDTMNELGNVRKLDASQGGVLCCSDGQGP